MVDTTKDAEIKDRVLALIKLGLSGSKTRERELDYKKEGNTLSKGGTTALWRG